MKVVFMGTPDFAVGILESILKAGYEVTAVVTQPDKPRGRGKAMQFPPVKECAVSHNIFVYQPVRIRNLECIEVMKGFEADLIVVAAFGQILPEEILEMPRLGCINVHASLLPKYRGAAPIQWAVIEGEKETGVTIMKMDAGLDTGDMIMKTVVLVEKEETGGSLFDKLQKAGGELCVKAVKALEDGSAVFEKQNDLHATYAKRLDKKTGHIIWNQEAEYIERLVRGLNPWPSAFTYLDGKTLKIWQAEVVLTKADGEYGTITEVTEDRIYVKTGKGLLAIKELQLEGKKRMSAEAFLRGFSVRTGNVLG